MASVMDVNRVERLARDIITAYGLPCDLVAVHDRSGAWEIIVRDHSRRIIQFAVPTNPPAQMRDMIKARLETEW